jgi:hypothetical protein
LSSKRPLGIAKRICVGFDKAVFQYSVQNSKSLIAMLSHKNTVHIVKTKAI